MIFDQCFLPLALDMPVSNCKAAVLVRSAPGILLHWYPPYLVSIPLSATGGGARWKTSNSSLTWAEGIRGLMGEKGLMEED